MHYGGTGREGRLPAKGSEPKGAAPGTDFTGNVKEDLNLGLYWMIAIKLTRTKSKNRMSKVKDCAY